MLSLSDIAELSPGRSPISVNLFGMFSLKLPQMSSERSASRVYRVAERLVARSRRACPECSRGNPEGAYPTHTVRTFSTTEAREQDLGAVPT
jgi:hypothetical protein